MDRYDLLDTGRGRLGGAEAARRDLGLLPSRERRHREAAMRQAATRTQASGAPFLSMLPRRAQARTNASCTTSCASAWSPIIA